MGFSEQFYANLDTEVFEIVDVGADRAPIDQRVFVAIRESKARDPEFPHVQLYDLGWVRPDFLEKGRIVEYDHEEAVACGKEAQRQGRFDGRPVALNFIDFHTIQAHLISGLDKALNLTDTGGLESATLLCGLNKAQLLMMMEVSKLSALRLTAVADFTRAADNASLTLLQAARSRPVPGPQ